MGHAWIVLPLILLIVLILFGPGKLSQLGGALGRSLTEFRKSRRDEPTETTAQTEGKR